MTKNELRQIYLIDKEIQMLEEELERLLLENTVQSKKITGMPFANTNATGNPVEELAIKIVETKAMIQTKSRELLEERCKILQYIYTIEEPLLRMIVKYRCVDCLNWSDIGDKLGYERTTVSKRFKEFLKGLE